METLGERIKIIRTENNETQEVFARKIGIKRNTLSLIESNKPTSEPVIRAICHEYHVNYDWLVSGEGDMYPSQSDVDIETITRAMEGQNENKKKLIRLIAEMPDELLDKMMEYLNSRKM